MVTAVSGGQHVVAAVERSDGNGHVTALEVVGEDPIAGLRLTQRAQDGSRTARSAARADARQHGGTRYPLDGPSVTLPVPRARGRN